MSTLLSLWPKPDPEAVVRDHGPEVYRRLKRIFGPTADVDDAYQSVFVEVLRSLPSFRGRARLSTWIRRITWNVAYQEMRLRYRALGESPYEEAEAAGAVDAASERGGAGAAGDTLESLETLQRLYVALAELDPKQRLAVVMHDVEGCTLKEISEATGRPLPTVASQLAAGRARLAHRFAELNESHPESKRSRATLTASPSDAAASHAPLESTKP